MPFILQQASSQKKTIFYTLTSAAPHTGVSFVVCKTAQNYAKQGKKVLIFDALLGLKNYPLHNPNQNKISAVLDGLTPLTELIMPQQKNIDVITGMSNCNISAIPHANQQRIKNDLQQLASNYDVVLIDLPSSITSSIFSDYENIQWVSTADQTILLKTLKKIAPFSNPSLILNQVKNHEERNASHLFIKNLVPQCQIIDFFE
ncbi:MAG: hypothetical protein II938_00395 [Alphaproteobacteria bacterium]|nr:hypothetical protein [Alphaproteobacteria bacterium]